ncbi:RNA polymerase sigma-70 factor [Gaoshiqia sediminis]|uniref:RNA polymerase sigma-70 factor n=1 Tax=Gaoshiqia sediminis TaxID=2986998 RepID=A0AA41Y9W8_9BACT|nr:RNA polymerase sigma-70 factor [Gaoshiqia sediminis]MCW0483967.1 RNA polymerase sigma-70 factor [Gaoshiqia sediminis]
MYLNQANSFNEIYTAYYRKSYLYVKSYVHDDMAAEDIVSDALIKLWERMKREAVDPVRPFLFSILKNSSLDYLKHQTIKRDVHGTIGKALTRELEIRKTSLESSDPNEIFSKEIQHIIHATLQTLPERTREIFLMSRFENKSHKEIAELFEISQKGVEYHIAQSIRELRVALNDYLPLVGFFSFLNY